MLTKVIYRLVTISVACFILIGSLYLFSRSEINKANHFVRYYSQHSIISWVTLDLGHSNYYLAGTSNDKIYLGNYDATAHVLTVDQSLKDTQHLELNWLGNNKIAWAALKIEACQFGIFVNEPLTPMYMRCKGDGTLFLADTTKLARYINLATISSSSIVMRKYNLKTALSYLEKINRSHRDFKERTYFLQKQNDGFFDCDGYLCPATKSDKLFYVYKYKNEFDCLDTNLHLIVRARTIDTNTIAKIKIAKIATENKITFASPPFTVNKKACANNKYLFVLSALRADNDDQSMFSKCAVFDLYDINNGNYIFSLRIPNIRDNTVSDFKVYGQELLTICGSYICVYNLNI